MNKATYFTLQQNIRESVPEAQRTNFDLQLAISERNVTVALVLSLLLGTFGIDRFYLGHVGLGLLKLITLGGFGIWTIIDWFRIMGLARSRNIEAASNLRGMPSEMVFTRNKARATKKFFTWLGIILLTMILIGIIFGEKKDGHFTGTSFNGASGKKGYILKQEELVVLEVLLKDEADTFSGGGNSFLGEELPSVSAGEVKRAYNENQVAADQKYFKKTLFLTGVVASINSGLGNEPYITLRGGNPFMEPQARFKKGNVEKIAALKKGQKLNLVCAGNGAIAGTPMFKNCQFANDYAVASIAKLKQGISDYLQGEKPKSIAVEYLAIGAITAVRSLPDASICVEDSNKCLKALKEYFAKSKMPAVIEELKSNGVQVSDNLLKKK